MKTCREDLPVPCFLGAQSEQYAMKHDPFTSTTDVRTNPSRRQEVVPSTQLSTNLASGMVPNCAFITPDLTDDMHDASVGDSDRSLQA